MFPQRLNAGVVRNEPDLDFRSIYPFLSLSFLPTRNGPKLGANIV